MESDLQARRGLGWSHAVHSFILCPENNEFLVLKQGSQATDSASVRFAHTKTGIRVTDDQDHVVVEGVLTVSAAGQCRLKVLAKETGFLAVPTESAGRFVFWVIAIDDTGSNLGMSLS